MLKRTLQAVGIGTESDIPANEIFSTMFDPRKYGLSGSSQKKINCLRDFISEYNRELPVDKKKIIHDSSQAAELLFDTLRSLEHEEVWVVYLNKSNRPLDKKMISLGSLDAAIMDHRKIIKTALEMNAFGLILYHCHPSGNPTPSACDVKETEKLKNALKVFDINLVDHIIISDASYYSFAEEREMKLRRG